MYSRKVQQSILSSKHNLNHFKSQYDFWWRKLINDLKLPNLIHNDALTALHNRISAIPRNLRNESSNLLKVWTHQCECVIAQKVRRGQQMFSLYSKLWEEQALKQFITNMKKQVTKHGQKVVLSAIGISAYNWEENRISEEEMRCHLGEIEYIRYLKDKTIKCRICQKTGPVDPKLIAFCDCDGRKSTLNTFENWTVFIEETDLIVWKRPHSSGGFEYKVYGNYDDVSAEDFLSVQIDTDYRKQWDPTAVELEIIERDCQPNGNGDLIYWEMQWPRLFSNRDYIFKRRFLVDGEQKMAMIISKSTEHPKYPKISNKHRIEDYWSSMVIKPYSELNKAGIEFSLTYFDNPGVNIPSSVTNWVAYKAMPDFLTRLREATRKYRNYCQTNQCRSIYKYHEDPSPISNVTRKVKPEPLNDDDLYEILKGKLQEGEETSQKISNNKDVPVSLPNVAVRKRGDIVENLPPSSAAGSEVLLSPSAIIQNEQTYWKYLHLNYYIS